MNVLITGACGGLGRAMAVECARRGYRLFLTDVNAETLACIKDGLERQFDALVVTKTCDLTDSGCVDALLNVVDAYQIRLDMLINIAGIDFEGGFLCREREQLAQIVAVNDMATLRITHAVLKRRRENAPFTLVFVSRSLFPMPLKATYAASKRFLLDFATALRQELKDQNVHVLTLCPGGMATHDQAAQAIAAQGFWGNITTNPLETVVRRTLDRALHAKGRYVPGVVNRGLSVLGAMLPKPLVAAAICRRWNRAQKKWLHTA